MGSGKCESFSTFGLLEQLIYILPSYNEGLPISVLEAMSYSLPIISTTVGGIPEILKNGENGFIMEPGDKDAIYHAIFSLMEDKNLCGEMGRKSFEKVQVHLPTQSQHKRAHLRLSMAIVPHITNP